MQTPDSRLRAALAAVIFFAVTACNTGTSPYMTAAPGPAAEVATDTATVVFVRPSQFGGADRVTIMDGKGRFLGDTLPGTSFSVKMPAGEHLFISWGENTSAVKATLAAGKVYYVEAQGASGSPRLALRAVTLKSPSYGQIDAWLAKSRPLTPDEAKGQAYLQAEAKGVESAVARGNKVFAEYDAAALPDHTLSAEDGK